MDDSTCPNGSDRVMLRFRPAAAEYLTEKSGVEFKIDTLTNLAASGKGPAYAYLNGRAVYEEAVLDEWLEAQLSARSPSARGRDRRPVRA